MSGINSGTGLFSGIDYSSLIDQLLRIDARPRTLAQRRVAELQTDQAAFLDLNSRLGGLKSAATKFRTQNIFEASSVASSNENALTGSASTGAAYGSFSFVVDRTVGTQQVLSRSFADRNVSAVGASSITIEDAKGRLDSDTRLADLNGGAGIERGKVIVTDHAGNTATIDLSRIATVGELLDKLNTNDTVRIAARVEGDKLVIEDDTGVSGMLRIQNGIGYTTATSLKIEGSALNAAIESEPIYLIGDATTLQSLNDGNGVRFNNAAGTGTTGDFTINTRDGRTFSVDIGDVWASVDGAFTKTKSAVADFAALRERVLEQTDGQVTVGVTSAGRGLQLVDATVGSGNFEVIDQSGAAADLKIVGSTATDTIEGAAVLAGLNTTLASNLGGGSGLAGGAFLITTRDGTQHNFAVTTDGSVADILRDINELTGGDVEATVGPNGVGIRLVDKTGDSGNFVVEGAGAAALGVATGGSGVASATVNGTRLQHRFISESTVLSSLNDGRGLGTGRFEIIGPSGRATIDIGTDSRNIADVIAEINSRNIGVQARINDNGDGLLIERAPGDIGTIQIEIKDVSGSVAKSLNLVGKSVNSTDQNFIDGSFEREIELEASDTLDDVVTKINEVKGGATASVIRDSSGASPFRLKFTATQTGVAGAFTVDATGTDLGLSTISEARNARVFFGSDDPARAVLIESSSNTIDGVIDGLTINARARSDEPVTLTVSQDTSAIETAVTEFVTAFNDITSRISRYTAYDDETKVKGSLLGDSTANELRRALFDQIQKPAKGISGAYRYLSQVGVKIGSGGTLQIDTTKLRAAIATDPEAVAELFSSRTQESREEFTEVAPGISVNNTSAATFSSLGVAEQVSQLVERYTSSIGGVMTRRTRAIDGEIASQQSRISDIDSKIGRRREYLTRQYAQLETTLANLQRQQSAVGQIGR